MGYVYPEIDKETQEYDLFDEIVRPPLGITANNFLHKAVKLMDERGKDYDASEGERSMMKTVVAFNVITGKDLSEAEGWLLLQLLKDVRQWTKEDYHVDSAEDCVAYAALKAEALANVQ